MANNIVLSNFSKTQEIGDSIKGITQSFKILDEILNNQKETQDDIDVFCSFFDEIFDELQYSYEFIKNNIFYFYDLWDEVVAKKDLFLKPIITLYPQKIPSYDRNVNRDYIEKLLYNWVTKTYDINSKTIDKPEYVEGQKILIYYILADVKTQQSTNETVTDFVKCITKDIDVVATCNSKRSGQACFDGCGCVSCSVTATCHEKGRLNCYYTDLFTQRNGVERYLRGILSYLFEEYPDKEFGYVSFVVEDCRWKLIKDN